MADKKYYTTPRGTAKFCHLVKPNTKFDPEGVYTVSLLLQDQEAADLIAIIDQAIEDNLTEIRKDPKYAKTKKIKENDPPYKDDTDKEGNETGKTLFNFKQKATATAKDGTKLTFRPVLYDSRGNIIHPKDVGFGSTVRIAFELIPYFNPSTGAGIQLRMRGVQILELNSGELTAETLGFGVEEDGYIGADQTAEETFGDTDTAEGATEGSDF